MEITFGINMLLMLLGIAIMIWTTAAAYAVMNEADAAYIRANAYFQSEIRKSKRRG